MPTKTIKQSEMPRAALARLLIFLAVCLGAGWLFERAAARCSSSPLALDASSFPGCTGNAPAHGGVR